MDDLQELLERTTINFPRSVKEREVYRILEFISGDLDYKIYNGNFEGFFSIEGGELKEKYETKIKVAISSRDFNERGSFYFSSEIIEDSEVFTGIRFDTIPGYDLEEHAKEEVAAWVKIKKSVEDYFERIRDIEDDNSG